MSATQEYPTNWFCPICQDWQAEDCGICEICGYDPNPDYIVVKVAGRWQVVKVT